MPLLLCAKIRIHDEARRGGGNDPTTTTCLLCAFSVCATNSTTVSAVVYGSACVSYLHAMDPYQRSFEESRRRGRWWWCVVCPPFLPFSSTSLSNYACFCLVRFLWPLLFSSLLSGDLLVGFEYRHSLMNCFALDYDFFVLFDLNCLRVLVRYAFLFLCEKVYCEF